MENHIHYKVDQVISLLILVFVLMKS